MCIRDRDRVLNGKWGINFVKGDVLASTWDPKTKKLKSYSNMEKKRSSDSDDSDEDSNSESEEEEKKKHKHKHKKRKLEKKEKKSKLKKSKSEKKEKKSKKEKKHKKEKKKEKKHAARLESSASASNIPDSVSTRLSVRSRWIKQKRAAIMDSKALNEIFMITND